MIVLLIRFLAGFLLLGMIGKATAVSTVGSPVVRKGQSTLEFRLSHDWDEWNISEDREWDTRLHVDHAFTDIYAMRLVYRMHKVAENHFKTKEFSLQNRLHLIKKKKYGWDGGIRFNYNAVRENGEPDSLSLRFYEEFSIKAFNVRFNQIFIHEIGNHAENGISVEWRSQITYPISSHVSFGLDFFHDIGNLSNQQGYDAQEHTIGPVMKIKLDNDYSMELGYRFAISSAATAHSLMFIIARHW